MNLLHETGLLSLRQSQSDTKLLILLRFLRFFAFGGSTIVLALYLHCLAVPDAQIGLFMSLTLVGDVISFALATLADGIGRRVILGVGCCLMALSGSVFAASGNFWALVLAGVVGIISPNGREIGPFSAIEESTLAHLTPKKIRSDIFAWYALLGSGGAALGKFVTGQLVQRLLQMGWEEKQAYRAIFVGYTVVGILEFGVVLCLSARVELHVENTDGDAECEPLMTTDDNVATRAVPEKWSFLPTISKDSRAVMFKLCLLFAVDSLASGLVPASWVTYFFHTKFSLSPSALGTLFSIGAILSALSALFAASLAKRIGLVPTMVFTHLPSAIALALIPLSPSLSVGIFFLLIRFSLGSMDIAPKAAFLSAVLLPEERTSVMGFVNVVRTGSQSLGPVLTGTVSQLGKGWVPFVLAGGLKAGYDLCLLWMFQGHRTREDKEEVESQEEGQLDVDRR